MGTQGLLGFVIDGQPKISYNNSDSYPGGLGRDVLKFLHDRLPLGYDHLVEQVRALRVVDGTTPPTEEDKALLAPYTDTGVGGFDDPEDHWYCLTRLTQGDLGTILEVGILMDYADFALSSLHCEWAYAIDLDRNVLDVYEGFKKSVPTAGLWKGRPTRAENKRDYEAHVEWMREQGREPFLPKTPEYKAIAPIASFPFSDGLPDEDTFLKTVKAASRYPEED